MPGKSFTAPLDFMDSRDFEENKILLIAFLVHYWDLRAARNRLLGYFSKSDQPTLLRNNCCINAMRLCAMMDIYTNGNKWLIHE